MPTVARTYVTAGVALVGAGLISAAPITTPQPLQRTASFDVGLVAATQSCLPGDASVLCGTSSGIPTATPFRTTADSTNIFNIPANLFIALANTPYNFFTALGAGNVALGSEPDGGPSFQPGYEGVTLTQPDGNVVGLGANLNYAGSWWVYSPTNILGTDAGDVTRYQALANVLVPFPALSVPLGNMWAAIAASQLPMDEGCTGTGSGACDNPSGILSKMFDVRHIAALFSPDGYTFPESREGITCSEDGQCYVKDPDGREVPWSGQNVKLDPSTPFTSFYNSLTGTPDFSSIKPVTFELVLSSLATLARGLNTAYNPFVLGTQCNICAPFVPNPDNKPIPGPVFEDPDTAETLTTTLVAEDTETGGVAQAAEATEASEATGVSETTETPVAAAAPVAAETHDAAEVAEALSAPATAEEAEEAPTGPKHRKPSATSEALKNVRESMNSTFSKLTDGFKKPSATSETTKADTSTKSTDSKADSAKGDSGSDSGGSED